MSFTFLHTADWQIGKAFGTLPRDVAAALTETRLDAIDRLAALAGRAGARHVLVAGDVFDTDVPAAKTMRQAMARIGRHSSIVWHLIPGNHDAHRPGGLWEQLRADDPPANLHVHLEPTPVEIEPGVWLLPAPLTGRASAVDPTAYFDAAATPPGALRVGLAHGSVQGFGSDGDASVNIAPSRAVTARLDYLALGDWHGAKQIDARTWYSGTPEPDRFVSNEPGHALVVQLAAAGALALVEKVRTAQFGWLQHQIQIRNADDLAALDALISSAAGRPSDVLVELELSGRVGSTERQAIGRRLRTLEASVRHLDVDVSRLGVRTDGSDLEPLGVGGELRQAGERLAAMQTPEATDALAMLLDIAAEAGTVAS